MEFVGNIRFIIQMLYLVTAIGIVFVVVSENRNPIKTISWVLLLFFLPVLGIIFYYFFGQDNRKHRLLSRKVYKHFKKRPPGVFPFDEKSQVLPEYGPLVRLLNKNNNASLLDGNKIDIYTNGKEKFAALFADIEQARFYIHIQYYIFQDDEIGNQLKDILIRKANEGVHIRVLYDEVANWKVDKKFYEGMRSAGIEISGYLKVRFPLLTSRVNYRNHRKIAIVDGRIGYIGGMNVADRYVKGARWGGPWRDTHIRIEGRGVYGLQSVFLMDWHIASGSMLSSSKYYPDLPFYKANQLQIAMDGPISQWHNLLQATLRIIGSAKKYLYIQTPYFLPTEGIAQALQSAALGGVDVRVMLPAKSDSKAVTYASYSYLEEMMKAGVRIYFYTEGFLHAKLLLSDDYVTVVGSANMDFRSFEHNFEVNAYVYDEHFARKMKKIFYRDQQNSRRLVLKEWMERSRMRKIKESVMRLFSPLL